MEYRFNDWHFVKHFKKNDAVFGCLWQGEKPETWGLANLVQMSIEQFELFYI